MISQFLSYSISQFLNLFLVSSGHFPGFLHTFPGYYPGIFQVFRGKNLEKTQTKNGLSLPRAASLRLTSSVTAKSCFVSQTSSLASLLLVLSSSWIFSWTRDNCHKTFHFTTFASCSHFCRWVLNKFGQMMDLKSKREETRPGTMRQEIAIAAAPIVAACCLVYCTARERQSPACKLVEAPVHASPK